MVSPTQIKLPPSRLNKLGVDFPFLIAPMVGISHVAFRELIRSYTPQSITPLLFTEMLSTLRIPSEKEEGFQGEMGSLVTSTGECYFIPQLLGNEESFIRDSIHRLLSLHPWGFDINMGCPASHTLKHNWGVRLMGDKDYAAKVVEVTKKHSPLPVSVKLRAGQGRDLGIDYLLDFTSSLEKAGADWLTLHCRSQDQGHKGYARWDIVSRIAKERSIPVVANGDIQTWQDALTLMNEFGVDGAMIARAAIARPWILWQIAYRLGERGSPANRWENCPPFSPEEEGQEYFRAVLRYSCLLEKYFGDSPFALTKLLFFIAQGSRWLSFGHPFYQEVKHCLSLVALRDFVNDYAEKYPQTMGQRTRL